METALEVEQIIRDNGATPATIGMSLTHFSLFIHFELNPEITHTISYHGWKDSSRVE